MYKVKKELIEVKLDELVEFPGNPRHNNKSAKMVAKSIEEYGYINPIIACDINETGLAPEDWKKKKGAPTEDTKYVILAGNTRFKALRSLNVEAADILVVSGLTPAQIRGFVIADNRVGEFSLWNYSALDRMVESAEGSQKDELAEFGVTSVRDNKEALEALIRSQTPEHATPSGL